MHNLSRVLWVVRNLHIFLLIDMRFTKKGIKKDIMNNESDIIGNFDIIGGRKEKLSQRKTYLKDPMWGSH